MIFYFFFYNLFCWLGFFFPLRDLMNNFSMFKMMFSNTTSLFMSFVVFHMYPLKGIILLFLLKIMLSNYSLLLKENTQCLLTNNTCRNTQEITKHLVSPRK